MMLPETELFRCNDCFQRQSPCLRHSTKAAVTIVNGSFHVWIGAGLRRWLEIIPLSDGFQEAVDCAIFATIRVPTGARTVNCAPRWRSRLFGG